MVSVVLGNLLAKVTAAYDAITGGQCSTSTANTRRSSAAQSAGLASAELSPYRGLPCSPSGGHGTAILARACTISDRHAACGASRP
jgi:hypothetical protein